jgi:hypothetical protein
MGETLGDSGQLCRWGARELGSREGARRPHDPKDQASFHDCEKYERLVDAIRGDLQNYLVVLFGGEAELLFAFTVPHPLRSANASPFRDGALRWCPRRRR